jgi:hypothetical protein
MKLKQTQQQNIFPIKYTTQDAIFMDMKNLKNVALMVLFMIRKTTQDSCLFKISFNFIFKKSTFLRIEKV